MTKKQSKCKHLDDRQSAQLARLIISLGDKEYKRGTDRRKRIAAPSGSVMLF